MTVMAPLSKTDRDTLAALAARRLDQIDLSVMGEIVDWSAAQQGEFYRAARYATPVALDSELVAWFRLSGPGFQTRMEAVLRAHMQAQRARQLSTSSRDARVAAPTASTAAHVHPQTTAAASLSGPRSPGRIKKLFSAEPRLELEKVGGRGAHQN
jgi:uncharacterized protein (DUF4415 family)